MGFISAILVKPYTMYEASSGYDKEFAKSPLFIEVNILITKIWAIIYFDMADINILMDLLDNLSVGKEEAKNIITGRCEEDELKVLTYDNIYYFEALGNDVFCKTKDKKYKVKEKLYELEEKVGNKGFIRVSKCFIVNIVKVDRIISWFNSKLILKIADIDEEVYVTRKYLNEFKNFLGF